MKKLVCVSFSFFFTISIQANEICDNGIDDDGDGLIDLNDSDCDCESELIINNTIIPNYDFENYSSCPDAFSQMERCESWLQGSLEATSDYYNCSFQNFSLLNLPSAGSPSNSGYVGFYNAGSGTSIYKEYISICLNSPLEAGKTYTISFLLGFGTTISLPTAPTVISNDNIEMTIFGSPTCLDIPFGNIAESDCPLAYTNSFVDLATDIFYGDNEWIEAELTFIPSVNINALTIGSSCLPSIHHTNKLEYYYLDRLIVKEGSTNRTEIVLSGEYCENNFVISTLSSSGETIQWYKDGIAISGETANILSIDTSDYGDYSCVVTDYSDNCKKSNFISINSSSKKNCNDAGVNDYYFYIPNSFTPNSDHINDVFLPIISIDDYSQISKYTFLIFNRWGELIFETNDPSEGWDGNFKDVKSPLGIYSYSINIKRYGEVNTNKKIGHVSLIR